MTTLTETIDRFQQVLAKPPAGVPAPATGSSLLREFDAHGYRCEVWALPRANYSIARYEWRVHFGNGQWDSGRTIHCDGPDGAVGQAEQAALIRRENWENERHRQREAAEGQAVVPCES